MPKCSLKEIKDYQRTNLHRKRTKYNSEKTAKKCIFILGNLTIMNVWKTD